MDADDTPLFMPSIGGAVGGPMVRPSDVDTCSLVLRLVQSKGEWHRLHHFLHARAGLGNDGQIPRGLLRRGLDVAGVHDEHLAVHLEELYELLDPEGVRATRLSEFRGQRPVALVFGSYT